jgi:hypothetical protein
MNQHLQSAKTALTRGGQTKQDEIIGGMHTAIGHILKYLEELEHERSGESSAPGK